MSTNAGNGSPSGAEAQVGTGAGSGSSSGSRTVIKEEKYDERPCLFRFITAITRTWGLLTLFGLWYCTVELLKHRDEYQYTQWYSLAVSIIVSFFELAWLINKAVCCKDDGNCCCTLWRVVLWVDNWRKTILYIALAIPEFLKGTVSWLAVICGVLLIVLAAFYFLKSFKYSKCVERKRTKTTTYTEDPQASLVENEGSPKPQDRYDTIQDESGSSARAPEQPGKNPFEDSQ